MRAERERETERRAARTKREKTGGAARLPEEYSRAANGAELHSSSSPHLPRCHILCMQNMEPGRESETRGAAAATAVKRAAPGQKSELTTSTLFFPHLFIYFLIVHSFQRQTSPFFFFRSRRGGRWPAARHNRPRLSPSVRL